jgi:hypothetical protein
MATKEHARKQIKKLLETAYYMDKFEKGLEALKPKMKPGDYNRFKQRFYKIHEEMKEELRQIKT